MLKTFSTLNVLIFRPSDELKDDYDPRTENKDEKKIPFHCHHSRSVCGQNQEKLVAQRKLLITCIICLVFMIGELVGNDILDILRNSFYDHYMSLIKGCV